MQPVAAVITESQILCLGGLAVSRRYIPSLS